MNIYLAHSGGKGDQGQGGKKKEKKQEKKEPEKKEKEVEPKEEMDAADEALAAEPKSKDPFDALPKGQVYICSSQNISMYISLPIINCIVCYQSNLNCTIFLVSLKDT